MLCPCCGNEIHADLRQCTCGARFVGQPLDEKPIKIQRYGAVMNAIGLLALVTAAALVFTKFFAFGAVFVIWSARRAMKLAKNDPVSYGGFKTATATLMVTLIAGSVAAGYTVAYIPRFMQYREIKHQAATMASMRHVAALLEAYKSANKGSYPDTKQKLEQFARESIPMDYWEKSIAYTGITEIAINELPKKDANNKDILPTTAMAPSNFVLRSNGPDGIAETEDDIVMKDGIFYTYEESKKMIPVKASAGR